MELSSPPIRHMRQDSHMPGNVGSLSSLASMDMQGPNQRVLSKEEQFTPITEDIDQQRDYVIVTPTKSLQSQVCMPKKIETTLYSYGLINERSILHKICIFSTFVEPQVR